MQFSSLPHMVPVSLKSPAVSSNLYVCICMKKRGSSTMLPTKFSERSSKQTFGVLLFFSLKKGKWFTTRNSFLAMFFSNFVSYVKNGEKVQWLLIAGCCWVSLVVAFVSFRVWYIQSSSATILTLTHTSYNKCSWNQPITFDEFDKIEHRLVHSCWCCYCSSSTSNDKRTNKNGEKKSLHDANASEHKYTI